MHLENLILQLWLCEINLKLLLQNVQGKPASVGPWGGQSGHALQEIWVLIAVEDSVFCLSAMVDIPFSFR